MLFPVHLPWGGEKKGVCVQRSEWAGGTDALFRQGAHTGLLSPRRWTPGQPKHSDLAKGWAVGHSTFGYWAPGCVNQPSFLGVLRQTMEGWFVSSKRRTY